MLPTRQPKTPITVQELKDEELYGVVLHARGEANPLPPNALLRRLYASEDFYERSLQIKFQPTRVFSDVWGRQNSTFPVGSPAELPADLDESPYIDEPAYDYTSDFWGNDKWGLMRLNWRPVRSITQIFFAFPGTSPVWNVDLGWLRLDRMSGDLQIVPSSSVAVYAVFNHFVMGVISGGRGVPQSIYVDYVTGFTWDELCRDHNDLLEGVRLHSMLSMLGLVQTAISPGGAGSNSLSIDGLSRSRGFSGKYGPYSGKIEMAMQREQEIRESWRVKEKGIPVAFLGRG